MPIAGYNSSLYFTGTSTSMTGEATTNTSGTTYQITDADKQILDPAQSVTVYDGVSTISASTYTVNYLEGEIILGSAPSGAVTIDANYLPRLEVACAKSTAWSYSRNMLDSTCMSETDDFRKRYSGLKDLSISLSHINVLTAYGAAVDKNEFHTVLDAADSVQVLEWRISGVQRRRALVNATSVSTESAVDDLVTESVEFELAGEGTAYYSKSAL